MSDLSSEFKDLSLSSENVPSENQMDNPAGLNVNSNSTSSVHSYPMRGNEMNASSSTVRDGITNSNHRTIPNGSLYSEANASVYTLTASSNGSNTPLSGDQEITGISSASKILAQNYANDRGSSYMSLPVASAPRDIPLKKAFSDSVTKKDVDIGINDIKSSGDGNIENSNVNSANANHERNVSNGHNDNQGQQSPELLATSIGMDEAGNLVPSTSNISLLSLNYTQMAANLASIPAGANIPNNNSFNNRNTEIINNNNNNTNYISSSVGQNNATHVIHSGPWTNKAQLSSINQQRHNYYSTSSALSSSQSNLNSHMIATPAPGLYRKYSMNQPQQQTQQQLQSNGSLTSPQPPSYSSFSQSSTISPKPIFSRKDSMNMSTPDSPPLNPTSVGGSPSGFWLGHGSPPNSIPNGNFLSNSYLTSHDTNTRLISRAQSQTQIQTQNRATQKIPVSSQTQVNKLAQHLGSQPIPAAMSSNNSNDKTMNYETPYASIGNRSPDFAPVGTLPPMTPLNLSGVSMMNDAMGMGMGRTGKSFSPNKTDNSQDYSSRSGSQYTEDEYEDGSELPPLDDDDNTDVFAEQRGNDDL